MESKVKNCRLTAILVENQSANCVSIKDKIYKIDVEEGDSTIGEVMIPSSIARGFGEKAYPRDIMVETLRRQLDRGYIPKRLSIEYTIEY